MVERQGAITMKGNPLTLIGPELKAGDLAPDAVLAANTFNGVKGDCSAFLLSQRRMGLLITAMSVFLLVVISALTNRLKCYFLNNSLFRWVVYYCLIFYIIVFAVRNQSTSIYMGF